MATYRSVQMSFWTDSKVMDDFTPEDKLFFLYIMTNPRTSLCGCYECSKKQMSRDTGYSEETIANIIYRMDKIHQVAKYDEETKEILILNWDKYNWIGSSKVYDGAYKGALKIKSPIFRYYTMSKLASRGYPVPSEMIEEIPYGYPMDITVTLPFSFTDKGYINNSEIIKEHNKEQEEEKQIEDAFNAFWAEYPKKKCKADARKAFGKVMKAKIVDTKTMMDALRKQKQTRDWLKDGAQYVPNAATWLNGKRWDDEIDPAEYMPEAPKRIQASKEAAMIAAMRRAEERDRLREENGYEQQGIFPSD